MIHPNDEQSLLRLLGKTEIPEDVRMECELRTGMYHRDGNSGPLRTVALIDMVRSMGYKPEQVAAQAQEVNWRDFPHDGSVRVEAKFFGGWVPGRFLGFVANGTLAVRLDDDPMVRECRKDVVRLAEGPVVDEDDILPPDDDGPDKRATLLDKPPALVADAVSVHSPEPEVVSEPEPVEQEDEVDNETPSSAWENASPGDRVWVERNGDFADAKLVAILSLASGTMLRVHVDGDAEPVEVPADQVTYAGAA